MPRFRQTAEILKLMGKKAQIRNLGVIAHIDHGKTTLTDSLLAGAGLLPPKIAGSARVLDYLEEEQKRGITIKTANISLLQRIEPNSFVINLVDTPGHVDFTGKVARALRAIDGVIVVVDAVEGIMAQTETVMRQALEERVCPVLFINKVDRLITELKFDSAQIQERFTHIIDRFNDLIEIFGESPFKGKWKVDAAEGSVAFGSALHKWGFTLVTAKSKNLKFSDIIAAYKNSEYTQLQKTIPLNSALLTMVVECVPSPLEAQKYRVEKIWKGNIVSKIGQAMINCDENGPAVMCVTNVQADQDEGLIASGRLLSGTLRNGDDVYLVDACVESKVQQVSIFMGALREPVEQVVAGNVVALSGLVMVRAGETIVNAVNKADMMPFEHVTSISDPVLTVTVEPKNPKDLPFMLEAMAKLPVEDPNIAVEVKRETGEYLLRGMGELHLEIAVKLLRGYANGITVVVSQPRVAYNESVTRKGMVAVATSPNGLNRFIAQVEPLRESFGKMGTPEAAMQIEKNGPKFYGHRTNLLKDCTKTTPQAIRIAASITSGFTYACKAGPLCGEPLRNIKVNLLELHVNENAENHNPKEIIRGMSKAVIGAVLTSDPVLLEPIYRIVVTVPTELAGVCSRILSSRRGKLTGFEQKGALAIITGFIPVSETIGLSDELRSATSGRAFWQSVPDCWRKIPPKLAAKIIAETRERKGLPPEVPSPEKFLEKKSHEA